MTIHHETIQALSHLFQTVAKPGPDSAETSQVENEPESDETPRKNGILERDYQSCGFHLDILLDPDQLIEATTILFKLDFYLESITGVDWIKDNQLEAVYDFSRYDFELCRIAIRVKVPRDNPLIPSITKVYTGANWHERETHDFFGIKFQNHPNPTPLLLPEDADFHPLLKDFKHEQTD